MVFWFLCDPFENPTLVSISIHFRSHIFRSGAGMQKDIYLHLDDGNSIRYRCLDTDCPSGYSSASYTTIKKIRTPRYHPCHFSALVPLKPSQRKMEGKHVVYAREKNGEGEVEILLYSIHTCEWYPHDQLELLLPKEGNDMLVCSARTKDCRQVYKLHHEGIPPMLLGMLEEAAFQKVHGLLPDIEWCRDMVLCAEDQDGGAKTDTILVRLSGEGQSLILCGPSGVGKSYLARALVCLPLGIDSPYHKDAPDGSCILETDRLDALPDTITAPIIVLGCRGINRFSVEDIIHRIPTGKAVVGTLVKAEEKYHNAPDNKKGASA